MKDEIFKFLKERNPKLCMMASSSPDGKPECAVMGYALLDNLSLILCTDNTSRKWKNLLSNPHVALVFGWSFEELNVQYEGTAELIESGEEFDKAKETYFAVHPEALEFKDLPETVYLKITPVWIRLSDYSVTPPRIEEFNLSLNIE